MHISMELFRPLEVSDDQVKKWSLFMYRKMFVSTSEDRTIYRFLTIESRRKVTRRNHVVEVLITSLDDQIDEVNCEDAEGDFMNVQMSGQDN